MKTSNLKCSSCGHTLYCEDAVGQWLECPRCGARFLIDTFLAGNERREGEQDDVLISHKEQDVFYFPLQCDYQSFREKCFDMMMHDSPSDIFSDMQVVEQKQCYLPYVASIGGEDHSVYDALYVGADEHDAIIKQCLRLSYKNSDPHLGKFSRKHAKDANGIADIPVDSKRMSALPAWASEADEVHYYPFYCLVCSYRGTTFTFTSMGCDAVKAVGLPVDAGLHRKPRLIELSAEDHVSFAHVGAMLATAILGIVLLIMFWGEVTGMMGSEKAFLCEHWVTSHDKNGWFAYILFAFYISWLLIKYLFFVGIGIGIAYASFFGLIWPGIHIFAYLKNRYTIGTRLKLLHSIQRRKQEVALSRFSVSLQELYDKKSDLHP